MYSNDYKNTEALFVRSICTNRANAVVVFEGSLIRYIRAMLYRIGLPSNTATPLALFGGSLQIELHSNSITTNRAIVLKSSCTRSITYFSSNRATLALMIIDYIEAAKSTCYRPTGWYFRVVYLMLSPSSASEVPSTLSDIACKIVSLTLMVASKRDTTLLTCHKHVSSVVSRFDVGSLKLTKNLSFFFFFFFS